MNELLEIIAKLDKQLNDLFTKLDINLPTVQREIYDRLIKFINKLSTRKGSILASLDNLKLLNKFKKELSDLLIDSEGMGNVVKDFINGIGESTVYINDYFAVLMTTFNRDLRLGKALQKIVIDDTLDLLFGNGAYVNLIEPVRTILQRNIISGASYKDLQNELSTYLDAKTQRYVKQITTDAIMGYERGYMLTIAQDLELEHYYYQGTKIATTRTFCQSRINQVYTKNEVEDWASLNWWGKNPETNKSNIFRLAGGYGCRHKILPISKEVYDFIQNDN